MICVNAAGERTQWPPCKCVCVFVCMCVCSTSTDVSEHFHSLPLSLTYLLLAAISCIFRQRGRHCHGDQLWCYSLKRRAPNSTTSSHTQTHTYRHTHTHGWARQIMWLLCSFTVVQWWTVTYQSIKTTLDFTLGETLKPRDLFRRP